MVVKKKGDIVFNKVVPKLRITGVLRLTLFAQFFDISQSPKTLYAILPWEMTKRRINYDLL